MNTAPERYNATSYGAGHSHPVENEGSLKQTVGTVLMLLGVIGILTALFAMPANYLKAFLPF